MKVNIAQERHLKCVEYLQRLDKSRKEEHIMEMKVEGTAPRSRHKMRTMIVKRARKKHINWRERVDCRQSKLFLNGHDDRRGRWLISLERKGPKGDSTYFNGSLSVK